MTVHQARPSTPTGRHPRFPPMVVFSVFIDAVEQLAHRPRETRTTVLARLGDHDRSQVMAALQALGLVDTTGTYDDLALRRLADPAHRQQQLRTLLDAHYGPQLAAIARGAGREELDALLLAPGRSSRSAIDKARRFLKAAMRAAGLDTSAPALTRRATPRTPPDTTGTPLPPEQRHRAINQHQAVIAQLLTERAQQVDRGRVDPDLDARLDWHMRAVHRLGGVH